MTNSEYFHLSLFGYRFPRYRPHLQWICMPKVLFVEVPFVEVLQFLLSNFAMKLNDLTPIWVLCLAETNSNQLLCSLDPSTWYHYQCNFFLFHFINQLLSIFNFIAQDILLFRRWTSVSRPEAWVSVSLPSILVQLYVECLRTCRVDQLTAIYSVSRQMGFIKNFFARSCLHGKLFGNDPHQLNFYIHHITN